MNSMPEIAIVIPTIRGREADLDRCIKAYRATAPDVRLYIERDRPSCGTAWIAGANRAAQTGFDFLHLTADDLEPHDGWLEAALETVEQGCIPAPLVHHPDGSLESAGLMDFGCYTGPYADWMSIEGTTVPFLTTEMWDAIGMLDTHYCTDLWVSHQGRRRGWETVIRTGMGFTHYNAQPGRNFGRVPADTQEYLRQIA
jgi:hypothetical protein